MTANIDQGADRELVAKLLRGDKAALDQFFSTYFPRVFRFALLRAHRDEDLAQDICQQVMDKAFRHLSSYRGEASLFTWLCQITRNELADYWRREKRRSAVVSRIDDDPAVMAALETLSAPESSEPEAQHHEADLRDRVHVALDALPTHYADALELRYLNDLSVVEIAKRLGQSMIATQSILQRARAAFRDAYATLSTMRDDQDRAY